MALLTLGTNANNTLSAIKFLHGMNTTDLATLNAAILNDGSQLGGGGLAKVAPSKKPIWPGALSTSGRLYIPNRGYLQVLDGDYIAYDANGWPILVSANAIAGGTSPSATTSWTHS